MYTSFDNFILSQMPTFMAKNYEKMLNAETEHERLFEILQIFDLGMRTLSLGLITQYLIRDKTTVSDPHLNDLIAKRVPKASIDTWVDLFFATLKVYEGNRDIFFMTELYDFYWDTTTIPHLHRIDVDVPFFRLTQIRNDFEHGHITSVHETTQEAFSLLQQILQSLSFIGDYELLLIIECQDNFYTFDRHKGLEITRDTAPFPEQPYLHPGWFYLSRNQKEFLQLDPLLIYWDNPESLLHEKNIESDTAIFERFTYNQLYYMLTGLKDMIEDREHVDSFIRLIIDTIRQVKNVIRKIESLSWWRLQEAAHKISDNRMSTVKDKYNSQLYIQRNDVQIAFDDFLTSDKRVFVLLGKSGVGKSNFILSLKDEFTSDHRNVCILTYDAANIDPDISVTEFITGNFGDYYQFERKMNVGLLTTRSRLNES